MRQIISLYKANKYLFSSLHKKRFLHSFYIQNMATAKIQKLEQAPTREVHCNDKRSLQGTAIIIKMSQF